MDPVYGYQAINVEAQERSPFSLLNWMKRMIGLRKQYRVFGRGSIEFLRGHNRKVLAYIRRDENDTVLCVANLARSVQPVELDLSRYKGLVPVEMLGLTEFPRIGELPYFLTLGGYGFYWFRLQQAPSPITARMAPETVVDVPQAPALLVGAAWETILDGHVRNLIERELLLPFLQRQRWYGGKARPARAARFIDWGLLRRGPQPLFLTIVEVEFDDGGRDRYFLPLTVSATSDAKVIEERTPHAVLAAITGARKGLLFDGALDDQFGRTLLETIEREEESSMRRGTVRALRTANFAAALGTPIDELKLRRLPGEQSNTSIIYGRQLILKLFRRLEPGINPDYELGRQLTEAMGFSRVPAVAGALEYGSVDGPVTLGMLQQLVESQADGWTHATDELRIFYDHVENRPAPDIPSAVDYATLVTLEPPKAVQDVMGGYLGTASILGRRTAEMHLALAADTSDRAFTPEPFDRTDLEAITGDALRQARMALENLERLTTSEQWARLPADVVERASVLLEAHEKLLDRIRSGPPLEFATSKIRVHGDYHLGQVLWAYEDFYILDFEGEPARPLAERRRKQSPLKDVGGMLRSFDYAAYAGLFAHAAARPAELQRLEPWARAWQTWTTAAFLRAYFTTVGNALFVPADPPARDALLRLFVLSKALYELNYELNNRPDWIRIPLWGIWDMLNGEW